MKDTKKDYEIPLMDVIYIDVKDIIKTSGEPYDDNPGEGDEDIDF